MAIDNNTAARLSKIGSEMDEIMKEIGPKLIRLDHLREEARLILAEHNSNETLRD